MKMEFKSAKRAFIADVKRLLFLYKQLLKLRSGEGEVQFYKPVLGAVFTLKIYG